MLSPLRPFCITGSGLLLSPPSVGVPSFLEMWAPGSQASSPVLAPVSTPGYFRVRDPSHALGLPSPPLPLRPHCMLTHSPDRACPTTALCLHLLPVPLLSPSGPPEPPSPLTPHRLVLSWLDPLNSPSPPLASCFHTLSQPGLQRPPSCSLSPRTWAAPRTLGSLTLSSRWSLGSLGSPLPRLRPCLLSGSPTSPPPRPPTTSFSLPPS